MLTSLRPKAVPFHTQNGFERLRFRRPFYFVDHVAASAGGTRPGWLPRRRRDGIAAGPPCYDSGCGVATRMGKNVPPPHPPPPQPTGGELLPVNLRTALEERYLAYALSTIMARAEYYSSAALSATPTKILSIVSHPCATELALRPKRLFGLIGPATERPG